jgi:hypothetical protein
MGLACWPQPQQPPRCLPNLVSLVREFRQPFTVLL